MAKAKFSDMVGKTLQSVTKTDEEIIFTTVDGEAFKMYHHDDCCESVTIEDITGDLEWLIGAPIISAEEIVGDVKEKDYGDERWTFYKIATVKGMVDIRWYGTSNGYYSTSVDFIKRDADGEWDRWS